MPSRQRALAIARRAVQNELDRHADQEYLLMARLAVVADQAVRQRLGRRRDLWPDLDAYTQLLPAGARPAWIR